MLGNGPVEWIRQFFTFALNIFQTAAHPFSGPAIFISPTYTTIKTLCVGCQ